MIDVAHHVYGDTHPVPREGGLIAAVAANCPAAVAGIRPGETVLAVDGQPVRDVLDWWWLTSSSPVSVTVRAPDSESRTVSIDHGEQDLGVAFSDVVFDGVRSCANACLFCFVGQLPPGLRPSLYVRDDDFRLSFLFGNFVTLTNTTEADIARIVAQRLSPLYVSVHATDPAARAKLVCAIGEDRGLERLERLSDAGIRVHVQIVLVPGVNDGKTLQHTLAWLAGHEGVESVGVVPLGFTSHVESFSRSYGDPESAAVVLDAIEPWRHRMAAERSERWVYPADEFYLAAKRDLPSFAEYDDFPQFDNGIGITRAFIDEFSSAVNARVHRSGATAAPGRDVTLVTGTLFAPVLRELAPRLTALGLDAKVLPVVNRFLGGNVSVAGLLTGADLVDAIRSDGARGPYLVPRVVANADGLLLDDISAADLPALTGAAVELVDTDPGRFIDTLIRSKGAA
jgi:putative radical SAM enzyme (TIGR03279 family)